MKIHNFKQQSPEWFESRLGKLTASSAQAISANGKGLETLCYEKAAEILSGAGEETYTNKDMERGNEQEKLARASYEMQTGREVQVVGFVEADKHTGASPDGLVGDDGMIEIKCQRAGVYVKTLYTKKIDSKHVWQMQMQMLVAERKWVDFTVFNENFEDVIIIRVERDEAKIEKIKVGIEAGKARIAEILKGVK